MSVQIKPEIRAVLPPEISGHRLASDNVLALYLGFVIFRQAVPDASMDEMIDFMFAFTQLSGWTREEAIQITQDAREMMSELKDVPLTLPLAPTQAGGVA